MQYVAWGVYGLAVLFTLSWVFGIRQYTLRGTPPMKPTINQTMLFVVCLALVPSLHLSPFHLLWMLPASSVAGLLSLAMPFALLSIPGHFFYRLACVGIDPKIADRNRLRVERLRDLVAEQGLTTEQAKAKLVERGEW